MEILDTQASKRLGLRNAAGNLREAPTRRTHLTGETYQFIATFGSRLLLLYDEVEEGK